MGTIIYVLLLKILISLQKIKKEKINLSKPLSSIYDPKPLCYDPDYNLIQFVEGGQIKKKI